MKDWALILGASSGFGAATAKKLAAEGINIFGVHLDRRSAHNDIQNLINELKKNNVNVSIFYPSPLHTQECFKYLNYKYGTLPVTENICDTVFNLPCYAEITINEQDYIINLLTEYFGYYCTL